MLEHTVALDALRAADGRVVGLRIARVADDGSLVDVRDLRARATVLATGGYGQVFAATSNPAGVDRRRAGARAAGRSRGRRRRDGAVPPDRALDRTRRHGQQALISEAVRGEGAVLVDRDGRRLMPGAHPLADLAPRDVVSATIAAHLRATGDDCVFLDATHLGADSSAALPRHRPGLPRGWVRPHPRARAGRPGRALLVRRRGRRPRRAHVACPGSSPSARSRAPGCRAPTGSPPTRSPRASSPPGDAPRCSPPSCRRSPSRSATPARGRHRPAARTAITAATTRDAGVLRDGAGLARLTRVLADVPALAGPAGPGRAGDDGPAHDRHPARRRRGRPRGEPWQPPAHDFPDARLEWEVRLVHRLDDEGRLHPAPSPYARW